MNANENSSVAMTIGNILPLSEILVEVENYLSENNLHNIIIDIGRYQQDIVHISKGVRIIEIYTTNNGRFFVYYSFVDHQFALYDESDSSSSHAIACWNAIAERI